MTILIGGVLADQLCFSTHSGPSFPVFMFWSNVTGTRLAAMSVQDKLICVRLVMLCCMFSMQLFLPVSFWLKVKKVVCIKLSSCVFFIHNTCDTCLLPLAQAQNVDASVGLAAHQKGVFNAMFMPNGSEKRRLSGRIVRFEHLKHS